MERLQSFVVNGGVKLPIGYRFCPTDEELLIHYLKKKAFAEPLPCSVISEFDVFQTEPWGLPGDLKEKRYFFSNRKGTGVCRNILTSKRHAGSGYWKSIGKDKQIVASSGRSNQVIGMRKTLVFWKGGKGLSHETRTRWVMHELRLVSSGVTSDPCQMPWEDFAVYRIFQNKKKKLIKAKKPNQRFSSSKEVRRVDDDIKASFIDFKVEEFDDNTGTPPPCSPMSH